MGNGEKVEVRSSVVFLFTSFYLALIAFEVGQKNTSSKCNINAVDIREMRTLYLHVSQLYSVQIVIGSISFLAFTNLAKFIFVSKYFVLCLAAPVTSFCRQDQGGLYVVKGGGA